MSAALRSLEGHTGELAGQRVLVRADLDVDLADGQFLDERPLRVALPTLRWLRERGARILIAAHRGQPGGRVDGRLRLQPVGARLAELLDAEVVVADDCVGDGVRHLVARLRPGGLLLLENLRFHAGEDGADPAFARQLLAQIDVYVDDAPALAHLTLASTVRAPGLAPLALAGLAYAREVEALQALQGPSQRPLAVVLGADRLGDRVPLLSRLIDRADHLLLGGGITLPFLAEQGVAIADLAEPDRVVAARTLLEGAARRQVAIGLPVDHCVDGEASLRDHAGPALPADKRALDIGPRTRELYARIVREAGSVLWLGGFESGLEREGAGSTAALARAAAAVVQAGGLATVWDARLAARLAQAGLDRGLSHVSACGEMARAVLLDRPLPGMEALREPRAKA